MEYGILSFQLRAPPDLPPDFIPHVAGSVEALGEWNPDMMQPMTCEDSNRPNGGEHCWKKDWKLSIVVPMMSFPVSYRFALLYGETADHLSLWERGENRTITVNGLGSFSLQSSAHMRSIDQTPLGRDSTGGTETNGMNTALRMTAMFSIPKYLWPVWGHNSDVRVSVGAQVERVDVVKLATAFVDSMAFGKGYWSSFAHQNRKADQNSTVENLSLRAVVNEKFGAQDTKECVSDDNTTEDSNSDKEVVSRTVSRSFSEVFLNTHYSFDDAISDEGNDDFGPSSPERNVIARGRLAIIMVGLPARGKTFTAVKLARFLRWLGHKTRHFNVGEYRRKYMGKTTGDASTFFNPNNTECREARTKLAQLAMDDMIQWMQEENGEIGIYDATNSSHARRKMLKDRAQGHCKLIFLESRCDDKSRIQKNVLAKVEASPDYSDVPTDLAVKDFEGRLAYYEQSYEPLSESKSKDLSYIVMSDIGASLSDSCSRHIEINRIEGYMEARICYYLLNSHLERRKIYLSRHGQSEFNLQERIGGDAAITSIGGRYSQELAQFMNSRKSEDMPRQVWTSRLRRTIMTARHLGAYPQIQLRALDEIDAGVCDGMTYEEIKTTMPEVHAARKEDKLRYRYPQGESYMDVIQRLEPIIIELERQKNPILVIAHQAVCRALYSYFVGKPLEEVPHIPMPLHTVIELTPKWYVPVSDSYSVALDLFQRK